MVKTRTAARTAEKIEETDIFSLLHTLKKQISCLFAHVLAIMPVRSTLE